MPTWNALVDEINTTRVEERSALMTERLHQCVAEIAVHQSSNVIYYASGFLQKPEAPPYSTQITLEDINGFMAGIHGLNTQKPLLLILHTPGGLAEAAQSIVEYLRSKCDRVDVVVPTYAMSAGTMIGLSADRIIMGRQSQLGPTDPQLLFGGRSFSAHSIVSQFKQAKLEIAGNTALAHAWAPILQPFAPALLEEAKRALKYGKSLVKEWLGRYMFAGQPESENLAKRVSDFFASDQHGSHGRRIGRDAARDQGVTVDDLEDDQSLQEAVLTLYHLSTIGFEQGPVAKSLISNNGRMWIKNVVLASPQPPGVE